MPFEKLFEGVVNSGLCSSCGTCVSACPQHLLNIPLGEVGPEKGSGKDDCPEKCNICYDACPGMNLPYGAMEEMVFGRKRTEDPVEQMLGIHKYHLVTHAVDQKIHQTGVAGASVSRLLIHGLETGFLDAAIVAGYDKDKPWQVRPYIVTEQGGVLAAARSKYGVCSINTLLAEATGKYERVGVVACPCHVWGIRKLAMNNLAPKVTNRIKVILGLYCLAQNYSLAAEYMITQRMGVKLEDVAAFGVKLEDVAAFQYRGGADFGGGTWVKTKDGQEKSMGLLANWGMVPTVFIGYQMERCFVCHDHLADLADLSCGDVWGRHEELEKKNPYGWTGIFVRTDAGEELINSAIKADVIHAERDDNMIEYYATNPGYRKRYGWPVPNVT